MRVNNCSVKGRGKGGRRWQATMGHVWSVLPDAEMSRGIGAPLRFTVLSKRWGIQILIAGANQNCWFFPKSNTFINAAGMMRSPTPNQKLNLQLYFCELLALPQSHQQVTTNWDDELYCISLGKHSTLLTATVKNCGIRCPLCMPNCLPVAYLFIPAITDEQSNDEK